MAIERLPEHLKSRRTAEAIMAPRSILVGGVGAAAAVLAGAPLLAALGVGSLVYGGLVAVGLPRRRREPAAVDPMSLQEPWRSFADDAYDARREFHDVVARSESGPIRERLVTIGERVDAAAHAAGAIAKRGNALDAGIARLDLGRIDAELAQTRHDEPPPSSPAHASWEQTVVAIEAQRASAERLRTVSQDARNRLRVLNARLDEMVARAVELSLQAADAGRLEDLDGDVATLVEEMESLRGGLDEAGSVARGA